jgi:hypothetical protein
MGRMVERFKNDIHKYTDDKVKVFIKVRMPGAASDADMDDDMGASVTGRAEGPHQHKWVEKMEEFRGALISVHRALMDRNILGPPRVKVCFGRARLLRNTRISLG